MADYEAVYNVALEFDEDVFKRRLLIDLALESPIPDCLKISFGPVAVNLVTVIAYSCGVDLDYTYTVSHTEQVPYEESSYQYDPILDMPVYKTEKKTKEVTKYETKTGHNSGYASACVLNYVYLDDFENSEAEDAGIGFLADNIPAVRNLNVRDVTSEYKDLELREGALSDARGKCLRQVGTKMEPGGFSPTVTGSSVSGVKYSCYMLPCYKTVFRHRKKTYSAVGYACGDPFVWMETPLKMDYEDAAKTAEKKAKTRFAKYFFPVLAGASYVVAVVLAALGLGYYWPFFIPVVVFAFGLGMYKVACVRFNSHLGNVNSNWKQTMIQALNAAMAGFGYRGLTQDEMNEFDYVGGQRVDVKSHGMRDIAAYTRIGIAVLVITFVVLLVLDFFVSCATCAGCI